MKQALNNFSKIAILLIPLAAFIGLRIIGTYIFTIKRHAFHFDARLAPHVQKKITTFVTATMPVHSTFSKNVCDELCKQFACVAHTSTQFIAPGVLLVEVEAQQPIITVDKTHVITASGNCIPVTDFYHYTAKFLPNITAPTCNLQDQYQLAALAKVAPQLNVLCRHYMVEWHDEYKVMLNDKKQNSFSIMCSATTLPNENKLAQCALVKREHESTQVGTGSKVPKHLVADVRFNKQIILFSTQGGVAHG